MFIPRVGLPGIFAAGGSTGDFVIANLFKPPIPWIFNVVDGDGADRVVFVVMTPVFVAVVLSFFPKVVSNDDTLTRPFFFVDLFAAILAQGCFARRLPPRRL
jgi:hypothetical protein